MSKKFQIKTVAKLNYGDKFRHEGQNFMALSHDYYLKEISEDTFMDCEINLGYQTLVATYSDLDL